MSVPFREPLTVDEQVDTYPRLTDSGVSQRISERSFPYYIAPHLLAQRVLGEGGTAIVFEALHTRLKVRVAVKMLKVSGPGAAEARERLQREAELCARIDNPRIPRIYDVDSLPDGTPYVVMEEVHGRPLDELLHHGPLDVDIACAVTCEVLEAVAELHSAHIVHRDIKPSNLILEESTGSMRVRVLDLGIAKPMGPHLALGNAAHLTQSGMLLGTPHYMANEQLLGGAVDERTDLYAVGVMLYETLAGRPPFTGDSVSQVIAAALRDDPVPLGALRADIPVRLQEIVERAMQRDPDLRYPSARDMLDALRAFQTGQDGAAKEPAILLPPPPSVAPSLPPVVAWPEVLAPETDNAQWASRALHSLPPTGVAPRRSKRARVWAGIALATLGAAVAIAWPAELDEHALTPVSTASPSSASALSGIANTPAQQLPFTEPPRATGVLKLQVPAQLVVDPDLVLPPLMPLVPLADNEAPSARAEADALSTKSKSRRPRSARESNRAVEPTQGVPLNPYLQRFDATLRAPTPLEVPPGGVPGNPYGDDYVPSNPYAEN